MRIAGTLLVILAVLIAYRSFHASAPKDATKRVESKERELPSPQSAVRQLSPSEQGREPKTERIPRRSEKPLPKLEDITNKVLLGFSSQRFSQLLRALEIPSDQKEGLMDRFMEAKRLGQSGLASRHPNIRQILDSLRSDLGLPSPSE